mmetsp:Transcript_19139/g.40074  ORF Transcript_19139/g.40074 Transcript_19139/m.40074 type:complete len:704 (+) Transcript_19139:492-2603(+)
MNTAVVQPTPAPQPPHAGPAVMKQHTVDERSRLDVIKQDPVMFRPNEEAFWAALDNVDIQVSSHRLVPGGPAALPPSPEEGGQQQHQLVKEKLRHHLARPERIFDILHFTSDSMPIFDVSQPRLRKPKAADEADAGAADAHVNADRVLTRISDKQQHCILSLNPTKLFPSKEGDKTWTEEQLPLNAEGRACSSLRNRKILGNYKNTGFSNNYIVGSSELEWKESGYKTLRGFNIQNRGPGETKLRHMLCIGTPGGRVFLKWCTQCHLWKNFVEYIIPGGGTYSPPSCEQAAQALASGTEISTFCGVCHTRQQRSREAQLQKRRDQRTNKTVQGLNGAPGVEKSMENGNGTAVAAALNAPQTPTQATAAAPAAGNDLVVAEAEKVMEVAQQAANAATGNTNAPAFFPQQDGVAPGQADALAVEKREKRKKELEKKSPSMKRKKGNKMSTMSQQEIEEFKQRQLELLEELSGEDFHDTPLMQVNEAEFMRAMDETQVSAMHGEQKTTMTLGGYLQSPDRLGDILYFPHGNLPAFNKESNPIPKRGNLCDLRRKPGAAAKYVPILRMGDSQRTCIAGQAALLRREGGGWAIEALGSQCQEVRNTSTAKKELENYKFSGFCGPCVKGPAPAGLRPFNANRRKVDGRQRHFICMETAQGKVFAKWCTQCHNWKNFCSFQGQGGKLNTFCAVCHRRQQVSRQLQRKKRE